MVDGRWGDALREARVRAGLTQDEVAQRAGVSVRTVRHIERGHVEPRRDTLTRLCRVLGYDPAAAAAGHPTASRLPYEIRLLGPLAILRAGVPVAMPLKQRVLLGLLAVQPDRVVSHDEIADALWSGDAPQGYQHLVYTYVARLRRIVGPGDGHWISTVRGGYVLSSRAMPLDLRRFEDDVARAGGLAATDPAAALDTYGRALRRWQGRLLEDLPALWQHPSAVRLALRHIDIAIDFADLALSLGEPARIIEPLTIAAHGDPLHEALQARMMLGLAGSGRRAAALRLYDDLRVRLRAELGVEPGQELDHARASVLAGQRLSAGDRPRAGTGEGAPPLRADRTPRPAPDGAAHSASGAAGRPVPGIPAPFGPHRSGAPLRAPATAAPPAHADRPPAPPRPPGATGRAAGTPAPAASTPAAAPPVAPAAPARPPIGLVPAQSRPARPVPRAAGPARGTPDQDGPVRAPRAESGTAPRGGPDTASGAGRVPAAGGVPARRPSATERGRRSPPARGESPGVQHSTEPRIRIPYASPTHVFPSHFRFLRPGC